MSGMKNLKFTITSLTILFSSVSLGKNRRIIYDFSKAQDWPKGVKTRFNCQNWSKWGFSWKWTHPYRGNGPTSTAKTGDAKTYAFETFTQYLDAIRRIPLNDSPCYYLVDYVDHLKALTIGGLPKSPTDTPKLLKTYIQAFGPDYVLRTHKFKFDQINVQNIKRLAKSTKKTVYFRGTSVLVQRENKNWFPRAIKKFSMYIYIKCIPRKGNWRDWAHGRKENFSSCKVYKIQPLPAKTY